MVVEGLLAESDNRIVESVRPSTLSNLESLQAHSECDTDSMAVPLPGPWPSRLRSDDEGAACGAIVGATEARRPRNEVATIVHASRRNEADALLADRDLTLGWIREYESAVHKVKRKFRIKTDWRKSNGSSKPGVKSRPIREERDFSDRSVGYVGVLRMLIIIVNSAADPASRDS